jgi:hypothetical protein
MVARYEKNNSLFNSSFNDRISWMLLPATSDLEKYIFDNCSNLLYYSYIVI